MKKILLVTLDITSPSLDRQKLFDTLKKQGRWWHYMKPTWLVYTDKSPEEVVNNLKPYMQGRGRLLVTPLSRPYQGLLPKDAWEWIHKIEQEE
jgi:hypothetical protein